MNVKSKPKKKFLKNNSNNNRPHTYMENIPKTFVDMKKEHDKLKKMGMPKKQMKKEEEHIAYGLHHKYLSMKKKPYYTKEYDNPKANVSKTIIKESLRILIMVALVGSVGGILIESIKDSLIVILPLIIILPALNGMLGNYGTVLSARFTTMLHKGTVLHKWWFDSKIRKVIVQIFMLSMITATLLSFSSLLISALMGFAIDSSIVIKIFMICILDTAILIMIISVVSISLGAYFHKKHEDPDNFLVPITTTIADFGNMLILFTLIILLF
ncbi:MAG: magnesium transporter [Nanoarchaeota archaeon]